MAGSDAARRWTAPVGDGVGGLAGGAQPVDRAGQRELRGTEPVDEVAAPDATGFLHRAQDRIDGAEAAVDALGGDRLAGQDAVPLEEREASAACSRSVGVGRRRGGSTSDQRPAASGRTERREAAAGAGRRAPLRSRPLPAQRAERREGVVRDLAGPDEVPQRVEDLAVRARRRRPRSSSR